MNARRTEAGRRNQIIYTIGNSMMEEFHYQDVEKELRAKFPTSTQGRTLNVSGNLSELSQGSKPMLVPTTKGDAYRFKSPTYRMGIRALLVKTDEERVERRG